MIALIVTACLNTTLHGVPTVTCHDFPIRKAETAAACEKAAPDLVTGWIAEMRRIGIDLYVPKGGWRCAESQEGEEEP